MRVPLNRVVFFSLSLSPLFFHFYFSCLISTRSHDEVKSINCFGRPPRRATPITRTADATRSLQQTQNTKVSASSEEETGPAVCVRVCRVNFSSFPKENIKNKRKKIRKENLNGTVRSPVDFRLIAIPQLDDEQEGEGQ